MSNQEALDQQCINTIRFLAVDAVQQAQCGRPGTLAGAAEQTLQGVIGALLASKRRLYHPRSAESI